MKFDSEKESRADLLEDALGHLGDAIKTIKMLALVVELSEDETMRLVVDIDTSNPTLSALKHTVEAIEILDRKVRDEVEETKI